LRAQSYGSKVRFFFDYDRQAANREKILSGLDKKFKPLFFVEVLIETLHNRNYLVVQRYKEYKMMKKRLLAFLLVFALLAVSAIAAAAETGTVTITGGTLSETIANVTLSGVTLDGTDQTATSASGSNAWSATDARGTGAGWNLTIAATDFSDGVDKTIDIAQADSEFKIQLLDANVTITAGNTKPVSAVTTLTPIPDTGSLKFLSAAINTGMGSYAIAPNFELEVPAETFVGSGTYTSTITVTAVSGP
jgi:hypothetical protein